MRATDVAAGAPTWVYVLLVGLVVLGVRRLKTRDTPLALALLPIAAFLLWSLFGVAAFAGRFGAVEACLAWVIGAAAGALTGVALPDPRGLRLSSGWVRQPASWAPLLVYLTVFVARFACGAWGAIVPAAASTATAIGIAVGAAATGRLVVGVLRWRPATERSAVASVA